MRDGGRAQVSLYPEAGLLVSWLPLSFFLHSVCVLSWGLALRTELCVLDLNVVDSVPEEFTHREVSVSRMAVV